MTNGREARLGLEAQEGLGLALRVGRTPRRCTWGASSAATWRPMWPSPMTTTCGGWAAADAGDTGAGDADILAGGQTLGADTGFSQQKGWCCVCERRQRRAVGLCVCVRKAGGVGGEKGWEKWRTKCRRTTRPSVSGKWAWSPFFVKDLRRSIYAKTHSVNWSCVCPFCLFFLFFSPSFMFRQQIKSKRVEMACVGAWREMCKVPCT